MSVAHMVEIRCNGIRPNGDACWNAVGDYGTATLVRARMRAWGWLTGQAGGKDYCPDCRESLATQLGVTR